MRPRDALISYSKSKVRFDPFGGRREHLNRTGFIHMNGRVYDPRIGRFLSPDPIALEVSGSQDRNRYSYAWKAPLLMRCSLAAPAASGRAAPAATWPARGWPTPGRGPPAAAR
jgi:RHS repeat-associated protein